MFDICFAKQFVISSSGVLIPGAGAFEVWAYLELMELKKTVKGRASLGVQAFADALLVIPKTLAVNSGFDATEVVLKLQAEANRAKRCVGLDIATGNLNCFFIFAY